MKSIFKKVFSFLSFGQKKTPQKTNSMIPAALEEQNSWWGNFAVAEEQSRFFKVGQIVICLDRYSHQWHITTYREGEQPFKNFAAQATNQITLVPTMPDRALLSKVERAFYIPTGESIQLYISSPLWIRIEVGSPPILLDEIPTETLMDTWFGKNTLEGELCYSSQTFCSTELDELPRDTTRVISLISIENRSKDTLVLRELKIPLPYLSIYADKQNFLWTEQLKVLQEDTEIETTIIKGPPTTIEGVELLTLPRLQIKPGLKNLFGLSMWK